MTELLLSSLFFKHFHLSFNVLSRRNDDVPQIKKLRKQASALPLVFTTTSVHSSLTVMDCESLRAINC
jgi:hypothetical protein